MVMPLEPLFEGWSSSTLKFLLFMKMPLFFLAKGSLFSINFKNATMLDVTLCHWNDQPTILLAPTTHKSWQVLILTNLLLESTACYHLVCWYKRMNDIGFTMYNWNINGKSYITLCIHVCIFELIIKFYVKCFYITMIYMQMSDV